MIISQDAVDKKASIKFNSDSKWRNYLQRKSKGTKKQLLELK